MTIRPILVWPDPKLLQPSLPVESIDDEVRTLVADMFETMYHAKGVGLAAPQIGVHRRVVVIDLAGYDHEQDGKKPAVLNEKPIVCINPVISNQAGKLEWREGCLSVPGETGMVTRAAKCTLTYLDLDGKTQVIEAEGLRSVAIQHEVDHLDGKVYVEYLSKLKRDVIRKKMLKLLGK